MRRAFLLIIIGFSLSGVKVWAGLKWSTDRSWATRSIFFQDLIQPSVFQPEQVVSVRAETFVHPAGVRNTVEVSGTKAPIGIAVRFYRLPSVVAKQNSAFEIGAFWEGLNKYFLGQVGVAFLKEGFSDETGSKFVVPQMTIRSLFSRKQIESVQHVEVAVSLTDDPHRLHTSHSLGYIFQARNDLFATVGFHADAYLLLGSESVPLYFENSDVLEREKLQALFGPAVSLYHMRFGELKLNVSELFLLSNSYKNIRRYVFRVFPIPTVSLMYSLGF